MESTSEAGRIHCSITSAELLREQMPSMALQSRGLIAVKGKGQIETVWVNEGNKHQTSTKEDEWSDKYFDRLSRQLPSNEGVTDTSLSSSSSANKPILSINDGEHGQSSLDHAGVSDIENLEV